VLEGKRVLVTGVATTDSIAHAAARRCQELGAEVLLAAFPRDLPAATEAAAGLPKPPVGIVAADLTSEDDVEALRSAVVDTWGQLDGALHAVAFAPKDALAGDMTTTPADSVDLAFRTSVWTYAALARVVAATAPRRGASLVGLDFDAARSWPTYNWMGPCKAALESLNRYLARDLGGRGVRCNLVAAGPIHTRAADAIPRFDLLLRTWAESAPLAWDQHDPEPTADAVCFLFSDLARAVTGEILHVDGGHHAMAAPLPR
jgi:enoyl-[acyl-carrier protein] reductase I